MQRSPGVASDAYAISKHKTVAIIIAGGRSQRMGGGDKTLRFLAGRPMISHVWTIIAPQVSQLVLNVNGPSERFTTVLPGIQILQDARTNNGPLEGVLVGLCWAEKIGATRLLTVPGDTPFLPHDLVAHLFSAISISKATVACTRSAGHLHPLISIWDLTLTSALKTFLATGNRAAKDFLFLNQLKIVDFSATPLDPFMNLNTLADLEAAEQIAQHFQSLRER